ncbi:multiple inositol polyphosphate phosphatase 1-like [Phymastichus coffea]|uniref:multiple inositol polyphosphate phosphatase 1-like n=1 Tax=Phymastichus coffea TaxID=108790 RepID=UPI00273B9F1C|nr:multiple inositol polyphosphate phosphatase 1-like [Phymastichus coffea]
MTTTSKVLFVLSLITVTKAIFSNFSNGVCYNPAQDFYTMMGSRTPYIYVHGDITTRLPGCQPLQMWMTARHGTRYPDTMTKARMLELEDFREQILTNHEQGRGQVCEQDLQRLRLWRRDPNFYEDRNGTLAFEGKKELHLLARRLKERFPEILNSDDQNNYSFITTNNERATSSLVAFAASLLNVNESTINVKHEDIKDAKKCPRWLAHWDPKVVYYEQKKFTNGPVAHEMLRNISDRLGFTETIRYRDAKTMFEVCRYETALNPPEVPNVDNINAWCQMFTKQDMIVLEYVGDLDYYYSSGPGNKMSSKINCGLVQKLFDNFARIENGNPVPRALFTFGHSTNVQSIMSQLRVYESEPAIVADNFYAMQNRTYRLSKMGPFCANVIAVFYKCTESKSPYKVTFHNSENEIDVPGCNGNVCDWEFLKKEFGPVLEQCNPNFCDMSKAAHILSYSGFISLILSVFVTFSNNMVYVS